MELLQLMAANANQVLSRTDIEDQLWGDVAVSADTVPQAIRKLRRAFGDSATAPDYVKTYPKRGYCLIAPVSAAASSQPAAAQDIAVELPRPGPEASDASPSSSSWSEKMKAFRGPRLYLVYAALFAVAAAFSFFRLEPQADEAGIINEVLLDRADDYYFRFSDFGSSSAADLYQRVLASGSDSARARFGLVNAYAQQISLRHGRPEVSAAPSDPFLPTVIADWVRDGRQEQQTGQGQFRQRSRQDLSPGDISRLEASGFLSDTGRRFSSVDATLRSQLERGSDAWHAGLELGQLRLFLGDVSGGRSAFAQAYDAIAERVELSGQASDLAFLQGAHDELLGGGDVAVRWYETALEHNDQNSLALTRVAGLYQSEGRFDQLDDACERLSELGERPDPCA